jgi:phage gp45-like
MADEAKDGVERVQEYGFTSVPLSGSDAVLVFVGGNRDHGVIVATDSREHRPGGMEAGDVAIYDHRSNLITLTVDGIRIATDQKMTVTAPEIEITGDVTMTGEVSIDGNLAVDGIDFKTHVHPENDSGGPTDPPQAG